MSESPKSEAFREYYYNHDCGIPDELSEYWLNFFDRIAQRIIETIKPNSVLDTGCARGFLVEALRNRGIEAFGIDISEHAISKVADSIKLYCSQGSISEPFDRSYDLIVSIDGPEHMESAEACRAIENFCAHSDKVLFSSTLADHKDATYVNVNLPEYWSKIFSQHGFYRDIDYDASFITAWTNLYSKRQLTPDQIVFEYERANRKLVKENYDLRQVIAENQSFLEDADTTRAATILQSQHYKNLVAMSESSLINMHAEIESLKQTIAKNEARLQEINVHWNALVNSTTWKALNKLGKFKDFPDLTTPMSENSLEHRQDVNPGGENKTGQRSDEIYRGHQDDYDLWVSQYDTLDDDVRLEINKEISTFFYTPLVSVLMPTYNSREKWLRAAIESVQAQIYDNWELCIADDCSSDDNVRTVIREYATKDPRIKYVFREDIGKVSACLNSALSLAIGEFVALLDQDDELSVNALAEVVRLINQFPRTEIAYSDEDKVNEDGKRFDPYFKPDWNPELFLGQNYLNRLVVFRRSLLQIVGQFRLGFEGAQDWDLYMRLSEVVDFSRIQHISKILYHKRMTVDSIARTAEQKNIISLAQRKVLSSHLNRTGNQAELLETKEGFWRMKLRLPSPQPKVSILIPINDKCDLLRRCIESIHLKSTYANFEILVINNQSKEESTKEYLSNLELSGKAKVLEYIHPFNYSSINNFAVDQADGKLVLLLNNDTEVISPDWLEEMVSLAIQPGIGAVGAKLYYPDGRIQHAGVILGIYGVGGHVYKYHDRTYSGQMGRAMLRQNLSAVTGACLMIEKEKYLQVGGLNERDLTVAYNDIDFCISLLKAGYRNVWTPFAELYHHESASRGYEVTPEKEERFRNEGIYMVEKWQLMLQNDPAYNRNLSLERLDFGLAFPPRMGKQ